MKNKYKFTLGVIVFLFGMCGPNLLMAQDVITGVVKDNFNEGLPGCNVIIKGTTIGVITDVNGTFSLPKQEKGTVIVVSYIGYESSEIVYSGQSSLDFALNPDVTAVDEVVIIGYGNTTKRELTGSVASISSEDFNKGNIVDPMTMLQGKIAGLNVVNGGGGDPNVAQEFTLRGTSTLAGGTGPLIIVDGVPGVDLNTVAPSSIKSVDVLKDGSAAAIYGTRGTNGVIIITTKAGMPGEPVVEFSSYLSFQKVAKKLENLDAEQYRTLLEERLPGQDIDNGGNTDWFDEITRAPINYNTSLSVSGGSKNLSYRASVNYLDNKGIVKNNGLNRLNTSLRVNQKAMDNRLNLNYKLTYSSLNRQFNDNWALQQAFRYRPTDPVYNADGTYFADGEPFQYYNPVALIEEDESIGKENYVTASLDGSYEIADGFKVGVLGAYNVGNKLNSRYRTHKYPIGSSLNGQANRDSYYDDQKLLELRAEYSKDIGLHGIQAFIGYSFQEQTYEQFSAYNRGFDLDGQSFNDLGSGSGLLTGTAAVSSYKNSNKLIGFYGRAMYNYDSKYLLSASIRREGSSKFGANEKWGLFSAISAGWIISSEDFMSDLSFVDFLKIRAGYGVTGNQDIDPYLSLQTLATSSEDRLYVNGNWINTYAPSSNPNPNLKWEEKREFDIGVDFLLFDSKLSGTFDYYSRTTTDLLWWYPVPVPPNLYNTTFDNVGIMTNKGIELSLDYIVLDKSALNWTTGFNFTRNRNVLDSFTNDEYELDFIRDGYVSTDIGVYTIRVEEGKPLGSFYGPTFVGVNEDGSFQMLQNSAGDADSLSYIGNAQPDFQLAWNNSFKYKNFDLNIFFRGVFGQDISNWHKMYYDNYGYFGGKNILASSLEGTLNEAKYSSRSIEDGSYVKLDNVTLGYNLADVGPFKSLRFYVSGQQLLTITNYSGVDPEISTAGLAPGGDVYPGTDNYNFYPRTKTYTIGFNATF